MAGLIRVTLLANPKMRTEIAIRLMSFSALLVTGCSCGSSSQSGITTRARDRPAVALKDPPPKADPPEDPDPTVRVVAQPAPCFIGPGFGNVFDNLTLFHRLVRDRDDEALATLEAKGIFIVLSPGTRFKVLLGENKFPHKWGNVASRRFIGDECMIEGLNLARRSDLPPEVSPQEEVAARKRNMARAEELLRKYDH
jgi:hypothetical protein